MKNNISSLLYRVSGVGLKFLLLFLLAKFLDNSDFVSYGMLSVIVIYIQYLFGLDIYTYANREFLLYKSNLYKFKLISRQYYVYFVVYFLSFPFLIFCFYFAFDSSFIFSVLFIVTAISEHYSSEICRFWVFRQEQVFSSFLYFIKSLLMVVIPILFLIFYELNIELVFLSWFISNFILILISSNRFNFLLILKSVNSWSLRWLKSALVFSIPLMLSALCSKAIFTFDRTLAANYLETDEAATYIMIISLFGVFNVIIDSAFFNFKSPKLISDYRDGKFCLNYPGFVKQSSVIIAVLSVFIFPACYVIAIIFPDKLLHMSYYTVTIMMLIFIFYSLSQVCHFGLYTLGLGKAIFYSQALSLAVVSIYFATIYNIHRLSVDILLFGVFVYSAFVLLFKWFFLKLKLP